jgi:membrane protease YdiL (CAAX protease family)
MVPWRPLLIFVAIAVGTTTAIALVCAAMGWSVQSPAWALLVPFAMWAPAFGRFVARRTVDRGFTATLPLSRWGITGAQVILWPLAVPLTVYGAAYAIAWTAGLAHWSPGGGKWTTVPQIAANLVVNLSILGVFGTLTAMGEEIGWRGYLQPRLDAAGVRGSVAVVWLCQLAYHAPLMAWAGYVGSGGFFTSLARFAPADLSLTFLWARESYRARSVWPAVFFHSFHNTISQWLFPKFFAGGEDERWLGEGGLLPAAGYVIVGAVVFLWMRWRGRSWQTLARQALTTSPILDGTIVNDSRISIQ